MSKNKAEAQINEMYFLAAIRSWSRRDESTYNE